MLKNCFLFIFLFLLLNRLSAQELIIQENDVGFCSVDGDILTSVDGYTGIGYADTDRGIGKSISWSVNTPNQGIYHLRWRYGNGGGSGDRPARLLINGSVQIDTVNFPHTGTWTNWTISDSVAINFSAGYNQIRIEAYSVDGLGNYDYLIAIGEGLMGIQCIPSYVLQVSQNTVDGGNVSYEPIQEYYDEGTEITLRAEPSPGYFFQSWSGDVTSEEAVFTFSIEKNTDVEAIFLPNGTEMDGDIIGYATVQDDLGTAYLVIGGSLGDSVHAQSVTELQSYLADLQPLIVTFSDHFVGTGEINVSSHKTLIGVGETAHLEGIELQINQARNVVIKNIIISHVTPQDAIEINGASKNIWIDHCEFYSDREHGADYYDGLLDIKNESSFITVSWCAFHDHEKTILISSGDQAVADSVTRVTFHHNYFYNCSSRLPSIRFGKAHIFNNYYKNCGTAINSRMGACVRVEKNYFVNVGTAVMMAFSLEPGNVELIDNYFGSAVYTSEPACNLDIPYPYESFLDEPADLPSLIGGDPNKINNTYQIPLTYSLSNYPNPFNPATIINYQLPITSYVTITIYNLLGHKVATLVNEQKRAGYYKVEWDASHYASGVYYYRIKAGDFQDVKKMVLIK